MSFEKRFKTAFDDGLADIKFFVKRTNNLSVDQLKKDAMAFQDAIDNKETVPVDGVD